MATEKIYIGIDDLVIKLTGTDKKPLLHKNQGIKIKGDIKYNG